MDPFELLARRAAEKSDLRVEQATILSVSGKTATVQMRGGSVAGVEFVGGSPPAVGKRVWLLIDQGRMIGLSSGGAGSLDLAAADARYVNVTGDTMTGSLTIEGADLYVDGLTNLLGPAVFQAGADNNGFKLTSVADPTADTDAANKRYVDTITDWGLVTYSSGWTNYGVGYTNQVTKHGGMATLNLNLKRTAGLSVPAEIAFATIPPGFRPTGVVSGSLALTASSAYKMGIVLIQPGGACSIGQGNGTLNMVANDYLTCSATYRVGG